MSQAFLQGFLKTILKGVGGGSTQINQQILELQVFTISRYFENCTQKKNILTTISLWGRHLIKLVLGENSIFVSMEDFSFLHGLATPNPSLFSWVGPSF
jgi:hypothetical protein